MYTAVFLLACCILVACRRLRVFINHLPTKTALGYMSPNECVYDAAPDPKWLKIWGCKCYALKLKDDRRKDLDKKPIFRILGRIRHAEYGVLVFCTFSR